MNLNDLCLLAVTVKKLQDKFGFLIEKNMPNILITTICS